MTVSGRAGGSGTASVAVDGRAGWIAPPQHFLGRDYSCVQPKHTKQHSLGLAMGLERMLEQTLGLEPKLEWTLGMERILGLEPTLERTR